MVVAQLCFLSIQKVRCADLGKHRDLDGKVVGTVKRLGVVIAYVKDRRALTLRWRPLRGKSIFVAVDDRVGDDTLGDDADDIVDARA